MKYFLIAVALLALGGGVYWWLATSPTGENIPTTTELVTETPDVATTESNKQTYKNDEWGIAFTFPSDWRAYENTFRAGSSLFNVAIQPITNSRLPRPIFLNLTTNDWGQTLFDRASGNTNFREITVATKKGVAYDSTDMSLPTDVYLFKTDSGFWITIISKKGYEKELNQVLESFEITPVEY